MEIFEEESRETMSETIKDKYALRNMFARRRSHTLARWLFELNAWGWPKEIPDPEPRQRRIGGHPRREAVMNLIEEELGWRYALKLRRQKP